MPPDLVHAKCAACGRPYQKKRRGPVPKQPFCSEACRVKLYCRSLVYHGCRRFKPHSAKEPRSCTECGATFLAYPHEINRRCCSGGCARSATASTIRERFGDHTTTRRERYARAGKARRLRLRRATLEKIDRATVFERDDWCCLLCGEPTVRDAVVPHPLAPTIDHIIPIARGGTHEYGNVQTAHFRCNSRKRDCGALVGAAF